MSNFDFLDNLPLLIFSSIFVLVSIIFIRGAIILLKAEEGSEKKREGVKILSNSLYSFSTLIIVVLIFLLFSYILNRGEAILPHPSSEEFPSSPCVNFPPQPEFVTIGKYCFNGPFLLSNDQSYITNASIYALLCKKGAEYDIIYIGENKEGVNLFDNEQYQCWTEKCQASKKNLYFGIFSTSPRKYSDEERLDIKQDLEAKNNVLCPVLE
ncbi:MAG: hypothetical protein U9Q16_00135 [Patescibacteria group bacterium]|nr:hypothetical protein [Patescibacteria group bacterium]